MDMQASLQLGAYEAGVQCIRVATDKGLLPCCCARPSTAGSQLQACRYTPTALSPLGSPSFAQCLHNSFLMYKTGCIGNLR